MNELFLFFSESVNNKKDVYLAALNIAKAFKDAARFLLIPKLESLFVHPSMNAARIRKFVADKVEQTPRKKAVDPFKTAKWELGWIVDFLKDTASFNRDWISVLPIEDSVRSIVYIRNELEHEPESIDSKDAVKTILSNFKTLWKFSGGLKNNSCGVSPQSIEILMGSFQQIFPNKQIDTAPEDWVAYILIVNFLSQKFI